MPLLPDLRQAVDGVHHEVEAVQIVQHRHVEGRGDGALFLVAADVDVVVVGAAVCQPVDQPRIGMEGEDDRLVLGEEVVEVHVAQPVRVLGLRLQLHEVDDVDHPDFQIGQMLAYTRRLFFHVQIILYGFDALDASGDFTRFIDCLLRTNEAAQLNDAFVSFHTDFK